MKTLFRILTAGCALSGILLAPATAQAAAESFFVDWSGAIWNNSAEAHGVLTVDDTLFPPSTPGSFLFPGAEVIDFSLTVSGASGGNGNFQLSDYAGFIWTTSSDPGTAVSLDLTQELVGQATFGGLWGSANNGNTGDFSLFANADSSAPTSAGYAFVLAANNGRGDYMNLVSFRPVPVPGAIWLFGSALAGLGLAGKRQSA